MNKILYLVLLAVLSTNSCFAWGNSYRFDDYSSGYAQSWKQYKSYHNIKTEQPKTFWRKTSDFFSNTWNNIKSFKINTNNFFANSYTSIKSFVLDSVNSTRNMFLKTKDVTYDKGAEVPIISNNVKSKTSDDLILHERADVASEKQNLNTINISDGNSKQATDGKINIDTAKSPEIMRERVEDTSGKQNFALSVDSISPHALTPNPHTLEKEDMVSFRLAKQSMQVQDTLLKISDKDMAVRNILSLANKADSTSNILAKSAIYAQVWTEMVSFAGEQVYKQTEKLTNKIDNGYAKAGISYTSGFMAGVSDVFVKDAPTFMLSAGHIANEFRKAPVETTKAMYSALKESITQIKAETSKIVKGENSEFKSGHSIGYATGKIVGAVLMAKIDQTMRFKDQYTKGMDVKINKVMSAEKANELHALGKVDPKPPYMPGTKVLDITLKEKYTMVRLHKPSNQVRVWLFKYEDVKGYTVRDLKNLYSIPDMPNRASVVSIPKGTRLRVGVASEIEGWGVGTKVQFEVLSPIKKQWYEPWKKLSEDAVL